MKKYAYRIVVYSLAGTFIGSHRICANTEEKAIEYFQNVSRLNGREAGYNEMLDLRIGRREKLLDF